MKTPGRGAEASVGFSRSSCLENYPTAPKSLPQASRWGCSMLHAGCYYRDSKATERISVWRMRIIPKGECALGMRGRRRRPHASRHTRHGTTRSRTGLPERARGVSPAAHRISLHRDRRPTARPTRTRRAPEPGSAARADVAQRSRAHRCCSLCTHDSKRMIDICVVFVHA